MKERFEAAVLDIGDVKLVVVFLNCLATTDDYTALERASASAGFEGELVAVWPDRFGRTRFFACPQLHAFFQAVGYDQLRAQINAQLELT